MNKELVTVKANRFLVIQSKEWIGDGKKHSTMINFMNAALVHYLEKLDNNYEP